MQLEELRNDNARRQKKGLPFIAASVLIWLMVALVCSLGLPLNTQNLLVFCCSCPLLPLAWLAGKAMKADIFSKENPLYKLGLRFTLNQLLYLLIVMWVDNAVPAKMVMVYAMVFGAHLLPYSWLYKSRAYLIFSIALPFAALILGSLYPALYVALAMAAAEALFALLLAREVRNLPA